MAQPDLGQTMLVLGTWGVMFFMAGLPWMWIIALGAAGASGLFAAYTVFPHVAGRIDRFLTGEGDTFQVDMGREALINGGWFGVGPGEGTVKRVIPDAHADFVFSVAGEEFGLIMCFFIMSIFAFIVLRGLQHGAQGTGRFHPLCRRRAGHRVRPAVGHQHGVNLQLMPAKGMTLPFISYGGSSLIAIAISMGMVLALTRKRPEKRKQMGFALSQRAVPAE